MLNQLELEGVGPAQHLTIDFKPRLNFLTGDNGLGKSFVLDIAWWVLTRTWARGVMAVPRPDASHASIGYSCTGSSGNSTAWIQIFKPRANSCWNCAKPFRQAVHNRKCRRITSSLPDSSLWLCCRGCNVSARRLFQSRLTLRAKLSPRSHRTGPFSWCSAVVPTPRACALVLVLGVMYT